jgi:hypothetical protein
MQYKLLLEYLPRFMGISGDIGGSAFNNVTEHGMICLKRINLDSMRY